MESIINRIYLFGDDIDTDIIIPARYLDTTDPKELARHCMEPLRPAFAEEAAGGGIIVAGRNFGCGSSREHAPVALLGCGVRCVVAESLARIFYRNAINTGLPVVVCPQVCSFVSEGETLEVNLAEGKLVNQTRKETISFEPLPSFMRDILDAGGLISYLKARDLRFEGAV